MKIFKQASLNVGMLLLFTIRTLHNQKFFLFAHKKLKHCRHGYFYFYKLFFLWLSFVVATAAAIRSIETKNAVFCLERRQQSPVLVHKVNVAGNVESALEKIARQIHLDS